MKNYKVSLTRVYQVNIEAENEEKAKRLAEFFIGDPKDESIPKERDNQNFSIGEIEMMYNEAMEAEEIG